MNNLYSELGLYGAEILDEKTILGREYFHIKCRENHTFNKSKYNPLKGTFCEECNILIEELKKRKREIKIRDIDKYNIITYICPKEHTFRKTNLIEPEQCPLCDSSIKNIDFINELMSDSPPKSRTIFKNKDFSIPLHEKFKLYFDRKKDKTDYDYELKKLLNGKIDPSCPELYSNFIFNIKLKYKEFNVEKISNAEKEIYMELEDIINGDNLESEIILFQKELKSKLGLFWFNKMNKDENNKMLRFQDLYYNKSFLRNHYSKDDDSSISLAEDFDMMDIWNDDSDDMFDDIGEYDHPIKFDIETNIMSRNAPRSNNIC